MKRYKPKYSANSFEDNVEGFASDNDQVEQNSPDYQKEIDGLQSQVNTLQSQASTLQQQEAQVASDEAALKAEISTLEASIAKNKKIIIGSLIVLGVISIVALIRK